MTRSVLYAEAEPASRTGRPPLAEPGRPAHRRPVHRQDQSGSGSIWVLCLGLGLLSFACGLALLGSAIGARHRAEAAADLAALAAAETTRAGGDSCAAAGRAAAANHAELASCLVAPDSSVTVTVAVVLPALLRPLVGRVRAAARAA